MTHPTPVEAWHRIAAARDAAGLDVLLADDVVLRSPAELASARTPSGGTS